MNIDEILNDYKIKDKINLIKLKLSYENKFKELKKLIKNDLLSIKEEFDKIEKDNTN